LIWSLYGPGAPHAQSSRGSFWWKDIFSLVNDYRSITHSKSGDGTSTLFWKDFWHKGELLCDKYPRLFSFALNEDATVADIVSVDRRASLFSLLLSVEAFSEFGEINQIIQETTFDPNSHDSRSFVWGTSTYTSARFYKFIFEKFPEDKGLQAIWKSKCLPKLRVFAWLLFKDRLNTKDLMQRKQWNIDEGTHCVLCASQLLETRDHLFFACRFSANCWASIDIHWDLSLPITQRFLAAQSAFRGPCFMEVVVCAAWNIWKERNDFIFSSQQPSFARWKVRFKSDLLLHQFRVKSDLVQPLLDWAFSVFL
jgi:hypothetical protein